MISVVVVVLSIWNSSGFNKKCDFGKWNWVKQNALNYFLNIASIPFRWLCFEWTLFNSLANELKIFLLVQKKMLAKLFSIKPFQKCKFFVFYI